MMKCPQEMIIYPTMEVDPEAGMSYVSELQQNTLKYSYIFTFEFFFTGMDVILIQSLMIHCI